MPFALTMTTCGSREAAEALAEGIVTEKLAGCVQINAVASVYEWQGKVAKDDEFLLLIKGRKDTFARLRDYILAHHSYDVPEIVSLDIADGNPAYLAWLGG